MARIVLVGNFPPPWGGIARHLVDLAAMLRRARIPHQLIDVDRGRTVHDSDGRRPRHVSSALVVPSSRAAMIAAIVGAGLNGDVIHLHTNGHNLRSWLLAMVAGLPRNGLYPRHLLTVHSGLAPDFLSTAGPPQRLLVRTVASLFARVICASPQIATALRQAGILSTPLTVASAFSPSSLAQGELPAALGDVAPPLIGCALSFGPAFGNEYGADVLFDALAVLCRSSVPQAERLRLAVFGPGTQSPELRALAERAGVVERTLFLGELDHPACLATLARLDVFVRPSRADGDSITVREALALRRPTVASAVGNRPSGAVLFPPGDVHGLAVALGRALNHPPPAAPPSPDPLPGILRLYRERLLVQEQSRTMLRAVVDVVAGLATKEDRSCAA